MNLNEIQSALKVHNIPAWLHYDFHNRDEIAYNVLGLDPRALTSRRWFYLIPKEGAPVKLVHRIESAKLDSLPGEKMEYAGHAELHDCLGKLLKPFASVAMQYSPKANIPTISTVDSGTVELVRSFGVDVVSSANLVQRFDAYVDEAGFKSHKAASEVIHTIKDEAFARIAEAVANEKSLTEYEILCFILDQFDQNGMTCDGLNPIVAINEHAADPHFEVKKEGAKTFTKGNAVLIDLWARFKELNAIYYDITWCAFLGKELPSEYDKMFTIVVNARKAAKELVELRFSQGSPLHGWEVDAVCRNVIEKAGYGEFFVHRTGHSIHHAVHGNGVNMDNLETKDERLIIPGACFSIEPGIYKDPFGVRTEINLIIHPEGTVHAFGPEQNSLLLI